MLLPVQFVFLIMQLGLTRNFPNAEAATSLTWSVVRAYCMLLCTASGLVFDLSFFLLSCACLGLCLHVLGTEMSSFVVHGMLKISMGMT